VTIAVIWKEHGLQWCAADTRLVVDTPHPSTVTEMAKKLYVIPVATAARTPGEIWPRVPHYWTQYGFVYSGSSAAASITAVTASMLLQNLVHDGGREGPPTFEAMSALVHRLAERFMSDRRRRYGKDGIFQAAFFGWCPHASDYKLAHINGRDDAAGFNVDLKYPPAPSVDGEPWLVLGSGEPTFSSELSKLKTAGNHAIRLPRHVIAEMVRHGQDPSVGGSVSTGAARPNGFDLYYSLEPGGLDPTTMHRVLNGLDLDRDVGPVGRYTANVMGLV
jgi:hypothetical protein